MFLRKHRLFTLLAILLTAGMAYLLGWSNVLTIKEISYTGSPTKSSEVTVKNLVSLEVGERLARIEMRKIAGRIQTLPWVDNADLSRNWISGKVVVAVTPRLPIATFNGQLIVDRNGNHIVATYKRYLPELTPDTYWAIFYVFMGIGLVLALEWYGARTRKT